MHYLDDPQCGGEGTGGDKLIEVDSSSEGIEDVELGLEPQR